MKLKHLKDKPLLSPPLEAGEWRRITQEDVEAMEKEIERDKATAGMTKYYMRGIGIAKEVTEEEKEALRQHLITLRNLITKDFETNRYAMMDGSDIARCHYELKAIGTPERIEGWEISEMQDALQRYRGSGDVIVEMHYQMKELGIPQELTIMDRRTITKARAEHRKDGRGLYVFRIIYYLQGLGLQEKVTEEDIKAIRKDLDKFRKEKIGSLIAEMHFLLHNLLPPLPPQETPRTPLPPIKGFGK